MQLEQTLPLDNPHLIEPLGVDTEAHPPATSAEPKTGGTAQLATDHHKEDPEPFIRF